MDTINYPISLAVVHEGEVLRRGLASLLEEHRALQVLLTVSTAEEYFSVRQEHRPSTVFASLHQGLDLLKSNEARQHSSFARALRVVVVADSMGELDTREALRAGVLGLMALDCTTEQLAECAKVVSAFGHYVAQPMAALLATQSYKEALTPREEQVLHSISAGSCNKTIAKEMGIALGTVKSHVKSILAKLEVSSRTEAAAVAARRGLVRGKSVSRVTSPPYSVTSKLELGHFPAVDLPPSWRTHSGSGGRVSNAGGDGCSHAAMPFVSSARPVP